MGAVLLAHLNAIAFFVGFSLAGYGIARGWSIPAACFWCGVVLMLLAAWPYLQPRRKT